MRLISPFLILVIIHGAFAQNQIPVELSLNDTVDTIESVAADSAELAPVDKKENVVLLMGRPIDASVQGDCNWMSALLEAILEYKASAFKQLNLIDRDSVAAYLPDHKDFTKKLTENEYLNIAKKLNVDYVGIQRFELITKQKSMFYYLEIYSVKTRSIETSIERNFKINGFGSGMDEIFLELLKNFKITVPAELTRFVRLPAVSSDMKMLKLLGDNIIRERFASIMDSTLISNEYVKICEKDAGMLVAYYRTGLFLNKVGNYNDAAEALNILFMAVPEYYPVYLPLAKSFRKANKFEDALRISTLGIQRGIKSSDLISEKAFSLQGLGKKKEAENVYKDIIKDDPNDPNALLYFAKINNDDNKPEDALKYSGLLLKLKKNVGEALLEQGRSYMMLSKNQEAISSFTEASIKMPSAPEPDFYLGDLYLSLNKYPDALKRFESVIQRSPDNIEAYLKAASVSHKAGNAKKAYELLKSIENKYSNNGILHRELGVLALENGDTSKAKIHLEASMRAGTDDDRVKFGLAWIYLQGGEHERAFPVFMKLVDKDEYKSKSNLGLSIVYIKRGQIPSALNNIKLVDTKDLNIAGVNKTLGDAMLAKGEKDQALAFYKKESITAKKDTLLQSQIAKLSYEISSPSVSRNEYLKLTGMGAGGASAFYRLAILSLRLKDKAGAHKYYSKAKTLADADAQTWFEIAQEFNGSGIISQAIEAYRKAVSKEPSMELAWVTLAEIYDKTGKDSAAADAQMKLFVLNGVKYISNLVSAGKIYEKQKRYSEAKKAYYAYIQKKPTDEICIRLAHLEFADNNHGEVIKLLQNVSPSLIEMKEADILAESYISTNQYSKALPYLDYILKKNPKDLRALELTAMMHEKNNNLTGAIDLYKRYLLMNQNNKDIAFHVVELYQKNNNIDGAITQLMSNIKVFPSDFRNFNLLARLYVKKGNWNSAVPYISKALLFKEASDDLILMLASAQLKRGLKAEAMRNYQKYLSKVPGDTTALFELSSIYYDSRQYDQVIGISKKITDPISRNDEYLNMLGQSYFYTGDFSSAIPYLVKAHANNKSNIKIMDMLAQCYRKSTNTKSLIPLLKEWSEIDGANLDIKQELAILLIEQSNPSDAISVMEDAVKIKKCAVDLHLKLAELYEKTGMDDLVLSHLSSAMQCAPKNSDISFKIALHLKKKNQMEKAVEYLRKTILLKPANFDAKIILGTYLNTKKRYKEASVILTQLVKAVPDNKEYRIALAETQFFLGKYVESRNTIKPVIAKGSTDIQVVRLTGLIYKSLGKADSAKQLLESVVISDKNCRECFIALGDIYFGESDFKKASTYYQNVLSTGEYDQNVALNLARSYHRLGETESAQQIYQKILAKDKRISEALYRVVHYMIEDDKVSDAKELLLRNGGVKNGWYYLADAELKVEDGKYDAAMVSYSNASKSLPNTPEIHHGIGKINLAKKKYSVAIQNFGLAMAEDPENFRIMIDLGKAFEGAKEYDNAMEMYKELARRQTDNAEVYYCMARIYSKKRDHSKAIQVLREGLRFQKNNAVLYYALGQEYRTIKMDDNAVLNFSKAVKIDGKRYKDSYKQMGNIYYAKNDLKKAKKNYELYIEEGGDDPKVLKLLKKMQ